MMFKYIFFPRFSMSKNELPGTTPRGEGFPFKRLKISRHSNNQGFEVRTKTPHKVPKSGTICNDQTAEVSPNGGEL